MQYSRKGFWVFQIATLVLMGLWIAFEFLVRPSESLIPLLGGVMILAVFALAFRAFFYLDEIQQTKRMRAWFLGAMLGSMALGLVVTGLTASPRLMNTIFDNRPSAPMGYFSFGVILTLVFQILGTQLVYLWTRFLKRTP